MDVTDISRIAIEVDDDGIQQVGWICFIVDFLHLLFNGDTGLLQKPRDIRDCTTYRMNQLEILRHYRNSLCYPRLELGGVLEIRINAETFFSSFALHSAPVPSCSALRHLRLCFIEPFHSLSLVDGYSPSSSYSNSSNPNPDTASTN